MMKTGITREKGRLQNALLVSVSLIIISVAFVIGHRELAREREALDEIFDRQLAGGALHSSVYLREEFQRFGEDVRVLTGIPPVAGYLRARQNNGRDPLHGESTQEWQDRMAAIFIAFMRPNPLYTRIRFIGVADGARTLVRVDQRNGVIERTPDSELQHHSDDDYYQQTIKLEPGQVYMSDITLNRENGAIEQPPRPMLRAATPVFAEDGSRVGIMVINVDFTLLRQRLAQLIPDPLQAYLLNDDGDFLWHPDATRSFGSELGKPYRVSDEFPELNPSSLARMSNAGTVLGHGSETTPTRLFAVRLPINAAQSDHAVTLLVESSEAEIDRLLDASRRSMFLYGGCVVALLILCVWSVLRATLRPLTRLTQAAAEIAQGNYYARIPTVSGTEMIALRSALTSMQTEVSAREAELRRHRDSLQDLVAVATAEVNAIVQSAVSGVVTTDEHGIIRVFNPAAERLFGWRGEDAVGQHVSILMEAATAQCSQEIISSCLHDTDHPETIAHGREVTALRKDGSVFPAFLAVGHARLSETRHFFVAFITDITLQKRREHELIQARDAAEAAAHAKSDFLSNMSHEIRTPMNAILGLAYLLEKQALPAESRAMVQKIHGAGRSLLAIINDILDFSKIEAHRLELERTPFRLADVLDNLATIMASTLGEKPVELIIGTPPPGAGYLVGDGLRLGQVLINLVSNAIKFTAQGEVVVAITRTPDEPAPGHVRLQFSVRDSGIGIPADKQKLIFQAFAQADVSTTRSYGGTGLGLAISSRLVELMGGQLSVASAPGHGSTFSFTVDLACSEPTARAIPEMDCQRVLIADDHPTARNTLADVTEGLGWQADVVAGGTQAIDAVSSSGEHPFDVILLDWRMPDLDGLKAAERIRDLAGPSDSPIIVMVTAHDRCQLQSDPAYLAADIVLTKPVTSSCLYNAVQEAKRRRGTLAPAVHSQAQALHLEALRILVVDDSDINRDVAERILTGEGAVVELAADGAEALTALGNHPDGFDIVLMDMQMPVMDGYTATRQIRAKPALAHLPVVALTAGAFRTQRDQALEAGVDAFVAKPFDVTQLIDTILHLTRREARPGTPATTRAASTDHPAPVLDATRPLSVWRDKAAYTRNLDKFVLTYTGAADSVSTMAHAEATALMHKMRGAALQLGLEALGQHAAAIEQQLTAGQDPTDALPTLKSLFQATATAIAAFTFTENGDRASDTTPTLDGQALENALAELADALDNDDLDGAESLLPTLTTSLPPAYLAALRESLGAYEFDAARRVVGEARAQIHPETELAS